MSQQNQQVSVEAALFAFRKRHGELADENVLLKARVAELEEANARLQADVQQSPASEPEPVPSSPYAVDERA